MADAKRNIRIVLSDERYRPLVEEIIAGKEGHVIYQARNKVFYIEFGDELLCVKAFQQPHFPNSFIYTNFRKSKARRSYENALRLLDMGIGTPQPIAYIEVKSGIKLKESYYISRFEPVDNLRYWEQKPDSEPLLHAFARMLIDMHAKGVWHKDFSPGNIMYRKTDEGEYQFYLIDLNRMKFDVHDRKKLMRNFRAINLNRDELLRFARIYAEESNSDPDEMVRIAESNFNDYIESKQRHQRLKKLLHSFSPKQST